MKLGNKALLISLIYFFFSNFLYTEEKIITSPLVNIGELKTSFE